MYINNCYNCEGTCGGHVGVIQVGWTEWALRSEKTAVTWMRSRWGLLMEVWVAVKRRAALSPVIQGWSRDSREDTERLCQPV